jgi:hypothetical protein
MSLLEKSRLRRETNVAQFLNIYFEVCCKQLTTAEFFATRYIMEENIEKSLVFIKKKQILFYF